jgi:hypothetical protein
MKQLGYEGPAGYGVSRRYMVRLAAMTTAGAVTAPAFAGCGASPLPPDQSAPPRAGDAQSRQRRRV